MLRAWAVALTLVAGLFLLRVLGQALVAFAGVRWLPPMREWSSGLLAYPILLPTQLAILGLQAWISADLFRARGVFAVPRRRAGRGLLVFSAIYFLAMLVRYTLTMAVYPERRWLGTGTIPIVFHWALAAYLAILGLFHVRFAPAR